MPELPEVRAHAERLTTEFADAGLDSFRPLTFTALKTAVPDPGDAHGHRLDAVDQRGKFLLLRFPSAGDDGITFAVHLMQGGRLKPDTRQSPKPRGGVARWSFHDGSALLLSESGTEHRAGVWALAGDPYSAEPLAHLAPDADRISAEQLTTAFAEHPMRLHNFLRDQHCIAGIGRRLANEVCHRAKLSPFAPTAGLGESGAHRVVSAIRECIEEDLLAERARSDMSSSKDRSGAVHHNVGGKCPECGDVVRAVEYRTHTVAYCATCQTGGKVLADNTTSKFLK